MFKRSLRLSLLISLLTFVSYEADATSTVCFAGTNQAVGSRSETKDVFGLRVNVGPDGTMATEPSPAFADSFDHPQVSRSRSRTASHEYEPDRNSSKGTLIQARGWSFDQEDVDEPEPIYTPQPVDEAFCYEWQVMPAGLMYRSYIAGEKEPRIQAVWLTDKNRGLVWETALGGRIGVLRYGTTDTFHPEGWQLDLEGAALPRVDPEQHDDLEAVDFRIGWVSTWCFGPNRFKAGYYHLSSHVGDEYLIVNPGFHRLNYVRDSLIAGYTRDITPEFQAYGEIAYALNHEDGALPLELQYGLQYSPLKFGLMGAPFAALNIHTREDFDFSTSYNIVAGWQWRGERSNHTYRVGMQYYDGPSMQWSFVNRHETLLGGGMWCDF